MAKRASIPEIGNDDADDAADIALLAMVAAAGGGRLRDVFAMVMVLAWEISFGFLVCVGRERENPSLFSQG